MTPIISIVIPCRATEDPSLTLDSLSNQTIHDFEVRIVFDTESRGAPWARNQGARLATGEYLLFSDNDITWSPSALETMLDVLSKKRAEEAASGYPDGWVTAYAYGGKTIIDVPENVAPGGTLGPFGNEAWGHAALLRRNIVDTGALMARSCFPGWDESLKRLQDWDLWLTMLRKRLRGAWVGHALYTTPYRATGISFEGSGVSFEEAREIVMKKHGL